VGDVGILIWVAWVVTRVWLPKRIESFVRRAECKIIPTVNEAIPGVSELKIRPLITRYLCATAKYWYAIIAGIALGWVDVFERVFGTWWVFPVWVRLTTGVSLGRQYYKAPPAANISLPPMLVNVSLETVVTPASAMIPFPAIGPKVVLKIFHWP
jgi:hypothetical protein